MIDVAERSDECPAQPVEVMGSDTFTDLKPSSHPDLQDSMVWLSGVGGTP